MRLQAALHAQLDVNPSPEGQQPVFFLLDADRRFDRNLLTHWINAHPDPDREHVIICLDLRDDRNPLAIEELVDALQRQPQACVAPLRLSWLQTDHAKKSGPRLRDVLGRGERRPPSWLCDRVARLNPERVHLTIGEPGATLDLADRFLAKAGLSAEAQHEEFAVFIARQAAVVLDIAERQLIGGRYKVPRYVHQSIRSNRAFKSGLLTIANETQRSSKRVRSRISSKAKDSSNGGIIWRCAF